MNRDIAKWCKVCHDRLFLAMASIRTMDFTGSSIVHPIIYKKSDINGSRRQASVENIKPAHSHRDDLSNTLSTPSTTNTATNIVPPT